MNLKFNIGLVSNYTSNSQIARILTENWVKENAYCPNCGRENVSEYPNNKPVADFYCSFCREDFELKSKSGKLGNKINDGAYSTMIERITSDGNPNFFFLTYAKRDLIVDNFLIIPKHFFQPEIIEKRKQVRPTSPIIYSTENFWELIWKRNAWKSAASGKSKSKIQKFKNNLSKI